MSLLRLSELNNSSLNEINRPNLLNRKKYNTNFLKSNLGLNVTPVNRRINGSNNRSNPQSYALKNRNILSNYSRSSSQNSTQTSIFSKKSKKENNYELVDFPRRGQSYGSYKGTTPKQAAKKAFSKLARSSNLNNSNQKFIVFVIRSKKSNKHGVKREFKYMGQRVKLEHGIEIKRGNKTVTIKYKNIVNKFKDLND